MSNKMYDFLKFLALIFLPALSSLYFGISQIWGTPYGSEICGTIVLVDTFLGALIGISKNKYNKEDN